MYIKENVRDYIYSTILLWNFLLVLLYILKLINVFSNASMNGTVSNFYRKFFFIFSSGSLFLNFLFINYCLQQYTFLKILYAWLHFLQGDNATKVARHELHYKFRLQSRNRVSDIKKWMCLEGEIFLFEILNLSYISYHIIKLVYKVICYFVYLLIWFFFQYKKNEF